MKTYNLRRRLLSLFILLVIFGVLNLGSVFADCLDNPADCDSSFDSGTSDTNWGDSGEFNDNFEEYPYEAFGYDRDSAWSTIYGDSDLMIDPDIRAAAFADDPIRASVVLNQNPELLDDAIIMADFDAALVKAGDEDNIDPENVGDTQYRMLNKNPVAKAKWLSDSYGLAMVDSSIAIKDYDGLRMTSDGEHGVTFDSAAVQGMRVNLDGSISTTIEKNGELISSGGTFQGGSLYQDDNGVLTLSEGVVQMIPDSSNDFSIALVDGGLIGLRENVVGVDKRPLYVGSFSYTAGEDGEFVDGIFELPFQGITVDGSYYSPYDSKEEEFILIGQTDLILHDGGTVLSVDAKHGSWVYYTQEDRRSAEKFCVDGSSCIVNTPGSSPDYRERLAFVGVSNGDDIKVKSPVYFSHIEVLDLVEGSVQFQSIDDNNDLLGAIKIGQGDDISSYGNDLSKINAGRIDVMYDEGDETILHHWSSNEYQKDSNYFSSKPSMVACTVGINCEQKMAQTFGKVISDGNSDPKTTIVFSGDNAYTSRDMESWCKNNGGCYIVNSRDVALTSQSENLIVTGHHWKDSEYVWRDSVDVDLADGGEHNPIDKLYFGDSGHSSPFDQLPASDTVSSVSFSACNTVIDGGYSGLDRLDSRYESLDSIQGWDGTAPLYESVGDPSKSMEDLARSREVTYVNANGGRSVRTHYFKQGDDWLYTSDGNNCLDLDKNEVACFEEFAAR
ncbi:hypothetical protein HOA92_06780 [archaeon]|jgi:hypothetical protein|nr:hypothetical protein [archaeon]MBT6762717.1 hypothetical protein [archaeon]